MSPRVFCWGHGFLWVRIVLQLRFFQFALQNVEFLLGFRNLIVLLLKPLSPGRFAVWVLFGGFVLPALLPLSLPLSLSYR